MAPKDLLEMTPDEYRQALDKLTSIEALKLGALTGRLIKDAERRGHDQARAELASAVAEPGGIRMMHPEQYCHRCFGPNLPWTLIAPKCKRCVMKARGLASRLPHGALLRKNGG